MLACREQSEVGVNDSTDRGLAPEFYNYIKTELTSLPGSLTHEINLPSSFMQVLHSFPCFIFLPTE